jgi:hypothetical protein
MKWLVGLSRVNSYLAHKQHLLADSQITDLLQVTRDIAALHATTATGPYLSLWARVPGFQREALEDALYGQRALARVLCMRVTLHAVPSDEMPTFFQAYAERRIPAELQNGESLLLQAGLCQEEEAAAGLRRLHRQVLDVLAERGPSTVRELSQALPELRAKVQHSVGKPYAGEFSLGSRLVPGMSALGLLVRARPRGTWRSNLYEYAARSEWLPDVDLGAVTTQEARAWLVRRYLSAFGPATLDDVQWWTGFSKGETVEALQPLASQLVETSIEGLGDGYLMLADDARRLKELPSPEAAWAFLLPSLDPYIMGYQDRRRFLAAAHRSKVFDRAGNAMPTVWVNGQVVGAWGQRRDGSVTYGLFEAVDEGQEQLLAAWVRRLEAFLE